MALEKELSINLGLPALPLTQNPELSQELLRVYNSIRTLAYALDRYSGALGEVNSTWNQSPTTRLYFGLNSKLYLEAGEDLTYGQTVGIKSDGKAWLADDGVLECKGWVAGPSTGATTGNFAEIQVFGLYPSYSPGTLTPGAKYYQSGTPGTIGASGTGSQCIGFAISDTQLFFIPQF